MQVHIQLNRHKGECIHGNQLHPCIHACVTYTTTFMPGELIEQICSRSNSATYLLTISLPDIDNVAMSFYNINFNASSFASMEMCVMYI